MVVVFAIGSKEIFLTVALRERDSRMLCTRMHKYLKSKALGGKRCLPVENLKPASSPIRALHNSYAESMSEKDAGPLQDPEVP